MKDQVNLYTINLIVKLCCYVGKHGEGSLVFKNNCFIGLDPTEPLKVKYSNNHQGSFTLKNPNDGTELRISGEKVTIIRQ